MTRYRWIDVRKADGFSVRPACRGGAGVDLGVLRLGGPTPWWPLAGRTRGGVPGQRDDRHPDRALPHLWVASDDSRAAPGRLAGQPQEDRPADAREPIIRAGATTQQAHHDPSS